LSHIFITTWCSNWWAGPKRQWCRSGRWCYVGVV